MPEPSRRFISGDWGTSRLRLRLVDGDTLEPLAEAESDDGVGPTHRRWQEAGSPSDREAFYLRALTPTFDRLRADAGADLSGAPLVLSGMASSTIGMRELPYTPAPFPLSGRTPLVARFRHNTFASPVLLVSGVRTDDDVMRGEETILLGLADGGLADALVILPGTHSKHAVVRGGVLETFRTYLTGELFAILREHSVLRPSLAPAPAPGGAFAGGVRDAPGANLLRELFALRARSVLHGAAPEANAARLSGLLIGAELAGLSAPGEADLPIVVAAPEPIGSFYREALEALGLGPRCRPVGPGEVGLAVVRGQRAILEAAEGR